MKNKEDALKNFMHTTIKSWTYAKMTELEKERLLKVLTDKRTENILKGGYKARYDILNAIYSTYLMGIGYNGASWREENE